MYYYFQLFSEANLNIITDVAFFGKRVKLSEQESFFSSTTALP